MTFLKLEFLNLKKGPHIYDLYYHKIKYHIKKEKPYVHFLVWGL
jgi:hypothetical protein